MTALYIKMKVISNKQIQMNQQLKPKKKKLKTLKKHILLRKKLTDWKIKFH